MAEENQKNVQATPDGREKAGAQTRDSRPSRRRRFQDNRSRDSRGAPEEEKEFSENLVKLNRVTKVLKGGRRFSFSALVIIGNKKGKVGYGFGKAGDVSEAIRKAIQNARKNLITVPMYKQTIPHWIVGKFDSARVLLKPAAPGAGIIAGGPVRIILEMAGVSDILSKCMGSRNAINVIKATLDGLLRISSVRDAALARGKHMQDLWS